MKSKKSLIIIIVLALMLIVLGFVGYVLYQNNIKAEEYDKTVKKYERIVKIANGVNSIIDEKVEQTRGFIATNPDVRFG